MILRTKLASILLPVAVSVLLYTPRAHSSLIIQPSVSYRSHSLKMTDLGSVETKSQMNGMSLGLELGVRTASGVDFSLAGDYMNGKAEITNSLEKPDFTHMSGAVRLGISSLSLLRIYLGYGFMNSLKFEPTPTTSDMKLSGQVYQAGLQFRLLKGIALGAQYNLNTFQKVEGTNFAASSVIDNYFRKVDSQDYSINLSYSF